MDAGEPTEEAPTTAKALENAIAELARLRKEAAEETEALTTRLSALENAAKTAAAKPTEARLTEEIHRQCNLSIFYAEPELPTIQAPPNDEAKRHMVVLNTNLALWSQAGLVPLTFGQLLSGTPQSQVTDAYLFLKSVVGEQVWTRFFDARDLTTEEYIPLQLGTILSFSLHKAEAVLKKCTKAHDISGHDVFFTELRRGIDEAKRARTGPYSA